MLVFLFLAALYESWSIPFAVVLAVPLGLFGALLAVYLRDYAYDIYTQIGIVTLIGLASKNAILIVEYAKLRREEGMSIMDAAIEAAHLRLRPILMTSFAFILGVTPLLVAVGAGAASRRALGTTVFGGMIAATLLAIFFVPVLFVVVERIAHRGSSKPRVAGTDSGYGGRGALRRALRHAFAAVPALLLAGCAVGPNYSRPAVPAPAQFRGDQGTVEAKSLADTKWFDLFHDDTLTRLVNTALKQNFDLQIAAERVLEARAQLGVIQAARLPNVDATGGFDLQRGSRIGANRVVPANVSLDSSYTQAGFSLGWELDVWGRVRRLNEAARAQYLASEEGRRGVVTTLIADVTTQYFQLRELDLELDIAKQNRKVGEDNLRLTTLRKNRGRRHGAGRSSGGAVALHRHGGNRRLGARDRADGKCA